MLNRTVIILLLFCTATNGFSQTLGGNAVFSFLTQPNTAQLSALGGVNVSAISNDVGMAFHNPALMRNEMNKQVNTSFNAFLAGIAQYSVSTSYHLTRAGMNIGGGIQYLNYGSLVQTDASGNILGNFRPSDYMVQVMASKLYKERFWIGATAKFIRSEYGQYRSGGMAMDIGLAYTDTSAGFQTSIVVKNLGTQFRSYSPGSPKEELPFDVQAGISKRLRNAPFQFSLTAHNLHRFNIYYSDTTYNAQEGEVRKNGLQKAFAHLILSAQVYVSDQVELNVGYNFLRRQDLNILNTSSGLSGFSFGAGVLLKKIQIRYSTGFYQQNMFHQFSLNFNLSGNPL